MTPPPKPRKKLKELIIIDIAKGPPPSKAEQVVCSQSRNSHHAVMDLRPYSISKRAAKRLKEKQK